MSAARRLETSARFCCSAISTQRSSLTGSGLASSNGSMGRASESKRIAGDLAQQFLSGGQGALRGNHGRRAAVVGGARLFHIGDGDQADLIARLCLFELALDGDQRHLLGLEIVLRSEHVEVALRDALHQVLLRGLVVRLGLRHLGVRALQGHPIFPAKHVLLEVDAVAMAWWCRPAHRRESSPERWAPPGGADTGSVVLVDPVSFSRVTMPLPESCGSSADSACGLASRAARRVASASRSCGSFCSAR